MKKDIAIVAFLIICLICAFAFTSRSQVRDRCPSVVNSDTLLLADETKLIQDGGEKVKIVCDNDKVFMELFKTHSQLFKRFTCNWKHDRYGSYKHYIIYLSKGDGEIIKSWAKTNL
jgi:hypothetical protein